MTRWLVLVSFLTIASFAVRANIPPGSAECDFATPPETLVDDGEEIVRGLVPELAGDLLSEGFVNVPPGTLAAPACPGLIQFLVTFDPPRERVMTLLSETERQGEYLADVERVQSVFRADRESIVQHDRKILFTRMSYQIHHHSSPETFRIWWELSANYDNDFNDIRGYWQLYDFEGSRTLAVYGTRVDVGPALPKSMQEALTRKSLRRTLHAVRDWVSAEGSLNR